MTPLATLALGAFVASVPATSTSTAADEPDWTLAILETAGFLGFGTAWYYVDYTSNSQDWDFEFSSETFYKKLTLEYARFENNNFYHNAFGHVISGTFYYNGWRANGFSSVSSFVAATIISAMWEFLFEWREVASINDMIVTPWGGLTLGEALHRNTEVLMSQEPTFARQLVSAALDPALFFNRYGRPPRPSRAYEIALWSAFGANDFSAQPGARHAVDFGIESEVFHAIDHRADEEAGWHFDAPYTAFVGSMTLGETRSVLDLRFRATHAIFGYLTHAENVSTFLGMASAFHHRTRRLPDRTDRYGTVDLFGPFASFERTWGGTHLWIRGAAYVDFSVMNAFALDAYRARNDISGAPSSIVDRGYYFGLGGAVDASAGFEWSSFELRADARIEAVDSIDGRSRFKDQVTNVFSLFDRRDEYGLRLTYDVLPGLVRVFLSGDIARMEGRIGDVVVVESIRRLRSGVGLWL